MWSRQFLSRHDGHVICSTTPWHTSLRDDLQAAIWERRDMIEGPAGTTDTDSFDLLANDYDLGSTIPAQSISHFVS